ARRYIEHLLALPPLVVTPEARRHPRAVCILEHLATLKAREVLEKLAGGTHNARLTREAKAALPRLAKRGRPCSPDHCGNFAVIVGATAAACGKLSGHDNRTQDRG